MIDDSVLFEENWKPATILFLDIVGFSKRDAKDQISMYKWLWKFLKHELSSHEKYIVKSTGDGALIISFDINKDLLDTAKNLQFNLKKEDILIRQGLHYGRVFPMSTHEDAIGDPINQCQRIMDSGDEDQILASEQYVSFYFSKHNTKKYFYDLGSFKVKHGEDIHIYNYVDAQSGKPFNQRKLRHVKLNEILDKCKIVDLTYTLCENSSCHYTNRAENIIKYSQDRGQSLGIEFYTTKLNNLYLNYGTHIDFPGHIQLFNNDTKIRNYGLNKFIAEALVIDVSDLLEEIKPYIKDSYIDYHLLGNPAETFPKFMKILESMEIKLEYFRKKIDNYNIVEDSDLKDKAIIFYTGLGQYWKRGQFESSRYAYFFNPHISHELAEFLVKEENRVSFIGIDALRIESPLLNYSPKENPFHLKPKDKKIFDQKFDALKERSIHKILLENDVLILENLKNLNQLIGKNTLIVCTPLKLDCTDNSITRAFAILPKDYKQKI